MSEKDRYDVYNTDWVLQSMWNNWALSFGAINLLLLFSIFLPPFWIPFVAFLECYAISVLTHSEVWRIDPASSILPRLASLTMLFSAIFMIGVLVVLTDHFVGRMIILDAYNPEIPFVTCLVVFPVQALLCAVMLWGGYAHRRYSESLHRHGLYAGDSVVATLYYRESRYQITLIFGISVVLGLVEYWYYFTRYINSNIDHPDRFFFCWMPIGVYLLSLFFMKGRYISLGHLYNTVSQTETFRDKTIIRFLVFSGNDILLTINAEDGLWDTPEWKVIPSSRNLTQDQACAIVRSQTHFSNFDLRYCFTNKVFSSETNVMHYAVFVDDAERDNISEGSMWFNAYMLDNALHHNALASALSNEIYRIHTITMAWKTYDRSGRRLYPVKNYRPTFRFGDLKKWTVDYDDPTWFEVARNNEDMTFFNLRRFWNNITGIFNRRAKA